jgi:hypothetical protein
VIGANDKAWNAAGETTLVATVIAPMFQPVDDALCPENSLKIRC